MHISNMHINNIIQTKQIILRNIYVFTYIHAKTTNEIRGHALEGEQGGVYE